MSNVGINAINTVCGPTFCKFYTLCGLTFCITEDKDALMTDIHKKIDVVTSLNGAPFLKVFRFSSLGGLTGFIKIIDYLTKDLRQKLEEY